MHVKPSKEVPKISGPSKEKHRQKRGLSTGKQKPKLLRLLRPAGSREPPTGRGTGPEAVGSRLARLRAGEAGSRWGPQITGTALAMIPAGQFRDLNCSSRTVSDY